MGSTEWTDDTWSIVTERIRTNRVTPVIGAGASTDIVGSAADIAQSWAADASYPFTSEPTLASVAQYVATTVDRASASEFIEQHMSTELDEKKFVVGDLADEHHIYRYLPSLDFPIWLTTNYDDLIERGLRSRNRAPQKAISSWTPPEVSRDKAPTWSGDLTPTADEPLVFYLHGSYRDDLSMVITESDYLEFLEQMTSDEDVLPRVVVEALARTSLLFIGYGFRDLNLQLLLRDWRLTRRAYAVQPLPGGLTPPEVEAWKDYYPKYLKAVTGATVTMYWGKATEFCADLDGYLQRSTS